MTSRAAPSARESLPGPAGALEVLIETPAVAPAAFAVVCHPHPSYGGTLDNKVVYILSRAFLELGLATIRFNYRGVGASEGQFADGIGETEDTLAMARHGRERWPGAALWLAGFSFGGAVAIRAASAASAAGLVTVAPAIGRVDVGDVAAPGCPWLLVQGDADELVSPAEVFEWVQRLVRPPQIVMLEGVEHFFHGKLNELRQAVTGFLKTQKPG